jgi:hypothetical protein
MALDAVDENGLNEAYESPEVQAAAQRYGKREDGSLYYNHPKIDEALVRYINKMKNPNWNPPVEKKATNLLDVSRLEIENPTQEVKAKYTLLEGEFPVDNYDQIKTAASYFLENYREFPPVVRHEYCLKLAQRAEELDVKLPNEIERYGAETYAPDLAMHLNQRKDFVPEEFHPILETLEKKAALVQPDTFAEALGTFDEMTGIDRYWDSRLADPYRATFGPSLSKIAEDDWNFTENGLYINEQDLKTLAYQHIEKVRKQFGQAFAAKFVGNPKAVFNKQTREIKILLARMASHDY